MSNNEMITLPREVVKQALEALLNEGEFRKLLKPLIEKSIDSICDALEQPDAGPTATAPEGWKLVPVVPTEKMLDAGRNACEGRFYPQDMLHGPRAMMADRWVAMINAAPQPPTTEQSSAIERPQGEHRPGTQLTDNERTELLDWVSACQSAYSMENNPRGPFFALPGQLQENRDSLVDYVNEILESRCQQPKLEPQFDAMSIEQERLAVQFCAEISGRRGGKPSLPDPVRLLEMAEALYHAEFKSYHGIK